MEKYFSSWHRRGEFIIWLRDGTENKTWKLTFCSWQARIFSILLFNNLKKCIPLYQIWVVFSQRLRDRILLFILTQLGIKLFNPKNFLRTTGRTPWCLPALYGVLFSIYIVTLCWSCCISQIHASLIVRFFEYEKSALMYFWVDAYVASWMPVEWVSCS